MFEKLIEDLCQKEGLIDIGHLGIATQSSISRWSKEQDAQRVVSNIEVLDYAFHTDEEENPWWQLEFENPKVVEYLIISNRKKKSFDRIASRLLVTALDEKNEVITLHFSELYFGSLPDSLPLMLPVSSIGFIKNIRISLLKKDYLHLSSIKVLSKKNSLTEVKNYVFFSNRTDGLGERLKALLNAMVLACYLESNFQFSWRNYLDENEYHSIDDATAIFSAGFIENHMIDMNNISKLKLIPIKSLRLFNKDGKDKVGSHDGVLVQQQHISSQASNLNFISKLYKSAFESIEFSFSMNQAKDFAKKVHLPKPIVAIHLRMGDIVYGKYRFMSRFYSKLIPIYVIYKLIEKIKSDGYEIIIFGQDNNFCKSLCIEKDCIFAGNLASPDFNTSQLALFDIVLMSRCDLIIAGSSGFSQLANWVGQSSTKNFRDYFSDKELQQAFVEANLSGGILKENYTTPLLKSFSISHYLHEFQDSISREENIILLKECIDIDINNPFYKFRLACLYYQSDELHKGDSILLNELSVKQENCNKGMEWLIKKRYSDDTTAITSYLSIIRNAYNQGSLIAGSVLNLYES